MKRFLPFMLVMVILLSGCTSEKPDDIDDEEEIEESDDEETSSKKKRPGTVEMSFSSFDGSGTSFDVIIDDPDIVKYDSERKYRKKNHKKLKGARYDEIFTFEGLKEGETLVTIIKESGVDDEFEKHYTATVDKKLKVKLVETEKPDIEPEPDYIGMMEPMAIVFIRFKDESITIYMSDNQTADDFTDALAHESYPPELEFRDEDGNKIVAELPWSLLIDNEEQVCKPGDIVLLDANRIAIIYYETELEATKIGYLNYLPKDGDKIKELFGDGDLKITFNVDFTE